MGSSALSSHAKSQKHKTAVDDRKKCSKVVDHIESTETSSSSPACNSDPSALQASASSAAPTPTAPAVKTSDDAVVINAGKLKVVVTLFTTKLKKY